jgi:hypothetical protein
MACRSYANDSQVLVRPAESSPNPRWSDIIDEEAKEATEDSFSLPPENEESSLLSFNIPDASTPYATIINAMSNTSLSGISSANGSPGFLGSQELEVFHSIMSHAAETMETFKYVSGLKLNEHGNISVDVLTNPDSGTASDKIQLALCVIKSPKAFLSHAAYTVIMSKKKVANGVKLRALDSGEYLRPGDLRLNIDNLSGAKEITSECLELVAAFCKAYNSHMNCL